MRDLIIKAGDKTPEIKCMGSGSISITGMAMPEDAAGFFFDLLDWASDYYREPQPTTKVKIALLYANTSATSMINKLFHLFNQLQENEKSEVQCEWLYEKEDQEMKGFIDIIRSFTPTLKFTVKSVEELPGRK